MRTRRSRRRPLELGDAHALSAAVVLERLGTDPAAGLDTAEARRRRRRFGLNALRAKPPKARYRILLDQLRSLIVWLLAIAALLALSLGHTTEGIAVIAVIVLNTAIGFFTELRAVRSMEALRALSVSRVNVRRHGRLSPIPGRGLVPGDIVMLEAGDMVGADLRVVEASKLQVNEAVLTGESLPVAKHADEVDAARPLAERANMLYRGTAVTRGSATAVVVAIGMATELGKIADLMETAEPDATPLEQRIDQLSRQFMWIALVLAAAIGVVGSLMGTDVYVMAEAAIALAVATVPEGLPMVATLALARGMWRMARRNALIERLAAVETLGSTTVILTDKTGTLTENRMSVARLILAPGRELDVAGIDGGGSAPGLTDAEDQSLASACLVAALCNNAEVSGGEHVGDPMEVALLQLAERCLPDLDERRAARPEVDEVAFDPEQRMMATVHADPDGGFWYAVKGAPDPVLEASTTTADGSALDAAARAAWLGAVDALGDRGLRVLALAAKTAAVADAPPYTELTLLALLGLNDPPRADVAAAIEACQTAGIRVVMVTGDHAATALNIAAATGLTDTPHAVTGGELDGAEPASALLDAPVFARVTPSHKLELLSAFQARGDVVAMLGDGVNDAPALRKADIGVAMGRRGSQVARQAADMVLRDDRFGTIVAAIQQGRVIFENIRKFVVYLMSCNLSELLVVGLASIAGAPLPLLPLQILYLNLVTDVFPAFALGAGEGDPGVMRRPPRPPSESLLARRHWYEIGLGAGCIGATTLAAFTVCLVALAWPVSTAVTVSFLTLALAQVWHVFNMRSPGSSWIKNDVTRNRFVWGAVGLCLVLVLGPVYQPFLGGVLGLEPLTAPALGLAVSFSLIPLVLAQVGRSLQPAAVQPSLGAASPPAPPAPADRA